MDDLAVPGRVLLLRHALAPGGSDPVGFRLEDPSTQRNLSAEGREQARRLGQALQPLRPLGVIVRTSAWNRCRETAILLDLGPVEVLPALNSTFRSSREEEQARRQELQAFLAAQPVDGPPLVLVTHQVNITALTGRVPDSGEGVVLQLNATPAPAVLGAWRLP